MLLCGFLFAYLPVHGESAGNVISSNATWTAANSPYTLTSTVTVAQDATLTIQPGVTVNIAQGATLQIDGTLVAKGTDTENIQMLGRGSLILTANSPGWNPQTSSGSIIENAVLSLYWFTVCNSAEINNNTINDGIYLGGGSPVISGNNVTGQIGGNESIQSPLISNNSVVGSIYIPEGSPVITGNVVAGIEGAEVFNGTTYPQSLCDAIDVGPAEAYHPVNAVVTGNIVTCGLNGIGAGEGDTTTALIENNLVENCTRDGMAISSTAVVENNTLINNNIGMFIFNFYSGPSFPTPTLPTVTGNNILNSSKYNIYYQSNMDLNATYNWWGTTNLQAISQTIYDHASDPTIGTVTIDPCLTEPNPQAYPNPDAAIIYPVTTTQPTQTSGGSNSTQPTQITSTTYFSIESNSTVSNLFFNSTDSELSFTVSGPTGTTGFAKVTIAKTLMPNGNLQVYMDGNPISSSEDSNGSYWIVTFTYHHSTHQVTIKPVTQAGNAPTAILNGTTQTIILAGTITALAVFGFLIVYSFRYKNAKQTT
ncbi:MAG: hypothetical protein ABSG33_08515 [Candidatus Bathyarchaeia archaeon]